MLADRRVQKEHDSEIGNEKVNHKVSELRAAHKYQQTLIQC